MTATLAYDLLVLVLYVLAVCRLTRLVVGDKITEPFRNWVARSLRQPEYDDRGNQIREGSLVTYLLFCAWCMSIWIGFALSPAVFLLTDLTWWLLPFVALTASQFTGLLHKAEE